jgi:hypothetical protein
MVAAPVDTCNSIFDYGFRASGIQGAGSGAARSDSRMSVADCATDASSEWLILACLIIAIGEPVACELPAFLGRRGEGGSAHARTN